MAALGGSALWDKAASQLQLYGAQQPLQLDFASFPMYYNCLAASALEYSCPAASAL